MYLTVVYFIMIIRIILIFRIGNDTNTKLYIYNQKLDTFYSIILRYILFNHFDTIWELYKYKAIQSEIRHILFNHFDTIWEWYKVIKSEISHIIFKFVDTISH